MNVIYRTTMVSILLGLIAGGCTTEALSYAQKHPELSPEQKQMFEKGQVVGGEAVAGLTKEQVRIIMHGYPDTYDKVGGEDLWIYNRKHLMTENRMADNDMVPSSTFNNRGGGGGMGTDPNPNMDALPMGPDRSPLARTTVFFRGDRATHAQVSTTERP